MWCKYIILIAFATVTFGKSNNGIPTYDLHNNVGEHGNPLWMLIPDDKGVPHIAILIDISSTHVKNVTEDVKLLLYTRDSSPYRLQVNDINNLKASGFNSSNPTKILIHGFTGTGDSSVIITTKDAYLSKREYNIIGVDWGVLCPWPYYTEACQNAILTGQHIADLVEFLVAEAGAKLQDFHIIGHSLGGQVAGFAGNSTKTGKVGRITGLDSAFPMFGNVGPQDRLDPSDAILVDAIHTCGGSLGFREPYATVDFYANGGLRPQPGCEDDTIGTCSHSKAIEYFIQSIEEEDAFPSVECLSIEEAESGTCTGSATGVMGDAVAYVNPGMYYTDTTK